jgi:hypothetical protein
MQTDIFQRDAVFPRPVARDRLNEAFRRPAVHKVYDLADGYHVLFGDEDEAGREAARRLRDIADAAGVPAEVVDGTDGSVCVRIPDNQDTAMLRRLVAAAERDRRTLRANAGHVRKYAAKFVADTGGGQEPTDERMAAVLNRCALRPPPSLYPAIREWIQNWPSDGGAGR